MADVVPTAYVAGISRRVELDADPVELDVAYCFDAWQNGIKPGDSERMAIYENWGAYANWNADFVVTFDRVVAADSLAMFGQVPGEFDDLWIPVPIDPEIGPGVEFRMLSDGIGVDAIPYVGIAEEIVRFNSGVKNLSPTNVGTTMTIELRISDPDSSAKKTLVLMTHKFTAAKTANWFDARIFDYVAWPADMVKAIGGRWNAGTNALENLASVNTPGILDVDTAEPLMFNATKAKSLGGVSAQRMEFSGDADFEAFDLDSLPEVDPAVKCGVIRVDDHGDAVYYGLVKDGDVNKWKPLDGATPGRGTVHFEMKLRRVGGKPVVNYVIGGNSYTHDGKTDIPIVMTGAVSGIKVVGKGAISSLAASSDGGATHMVFR